MKEIEQHLKILGFYQLIGGIVGIIMCAYFFNNILIQIIVSFGFYGFCCYCGYLLIRRKYLKGLNYSILNQAFQIISFGIFGFAIKYTSGLYAGFGIDLSNDFITKFDIGFNSWKLYLNSNPELAFLYINIIPILIIGFIFRTKDKIEKINESIDNIGKH